MRKILLFPLIAIVLVPPVSADELRHTLISSAKNANAARWETTSKEATPSCPTAWSIKKYRLHGGKQDGVDLIVVDNGKLTFTVVPTRGMGMLSAQLGDVRLGWDSPVKDVVHPKYVNLTARGGLGWLDGFSEFACRCGLENNGGPGPDKIVNNTGDETTVELTLHGKIANVPAREVEVIVDRQAPYRLRIRGVVSETMFLGPKLELVTEISTEPGSDTFRIADTITNAGSQPQEFEIIYHTNFGKPLLEEGSTFLAPVQRVAPMNAHAAKSVSSYGRYEGPTPGWIEQVYCAWPLADAKDRTLVMIRNREQDKGASLAYSIKELPYLTLWKNTAAEKDGYVTGIEPGTNFPFPRRAERKAGRVPKLAGGASHAVRIDVRVHVGKDAVKQAADRIAAIQGDRKALIDEMPMKVE
jgi:hypothetical protein